MGDSYLLWTFIISLGVIIGLIMSKKFNPSLCLFVGAIVAAKRRVEGSCDARQIHTTQDRGNDCANE